MNGTLLKAQLSLAFVAYTLSLLKYLQVNDIRRYNSDLLYLPSLFRDITEWGGHLFEWRLPPAPYFFPDMTLYFPLATLIENWHLSFTLTAVAQVILFTIGWCLLGTFFFEDSKQYRGYVSFVLTVIAALLVAIPRVEALVTHHFLITYHFGVMLVIPYILALTLQLIKGGSKRLILLTLLVGSVGLITLSDAIAIPQLVAPLILALFFLWLLNEARWKVVLIPSIGVILGLFFGQGSKYWLIKYQPMPTSATPLVQQMADSLAEIGWTTIEFWRGNNRTTLILIIIAIVIHLASVLLAVHLASTERSSRREFVLLSVFALASIFLSIAAVIGTGVYRDFIGIRYLYPLIILPVYSLLPIGYFLLTRVGSGRLLILSVVLLLLGGHVNALTDLDNLHKYTDSYPELVACIDEETATRGVQSGVGLYWDAKYISMLSRRNVTVLQVYPGFSPNIWINNPEWYARFPPQFIVHNPLQQNGLQMDRIINTYGYPQEIAYCPERELWFYNRPEDIFFQQSFADNPLVANWCEPEVSRNIPGYVWRGETGINIGTTIVADDQEGVVSSGYLPDHPWGNYELTLDYQHTGDEDEETIGEIRVGLMRLGNTEKETEWQSKPLQADRLTETIRFAFSENNHVFVQVYFKGDGTFTLNQYRLRKVSGDSCN